LWRELPRNTQTPRPVKTPENVGTQELFKGAPGRPGDVSSRHSGSFKSHPGLAAPDNQGRQSYCDERGAKLRLGLSQDHHQRAGVLWNWLGPNDNYQMMAVITELEKHLKPWLIGKDPDRIEDLWNSADYRTYWRAGPSTTKRSAPWMKRFGSKPSQAVMNSTVVGTSVEP
jgi:hypothetical protein